MKFAIITDIHHGKPHHTKRGDAAMDLMAAFKEDGNAIAPDLVFDLGDRITDADHATDLALVGDVALAFGALDAPVHHICGNHDREHLSVAENVEIMGQNSVAWTVRGRDPFACSLPITSQRWTPPLTPFRVGRPKG